MSSFEVKLSSLLVEQKNLNSVALQLASISMQITDITARLSVKSSSISGVKKNLRSISSTTSEKGRNLKGMSSAVSDIAVVYKSAEQQITGYGGGMANILLAKNISSLLQYFADSNGVIRNVFETLGSNDLFQLGENKKVFSLFGKDGTLITSVDWNKWDVGNMSASGALLSILSRAEWGDIAVENIVSILKGEAKGNAFADFDIKNGNIGAGINGNASFSVLEDQLSGSIGDYLKGTGILSVLTGAVEARAGSQLLRDGKLDPGIYALAEGTAHGITAEGNTTLGTDKNNIHGSAQGSIGYFNGKAGFGAGYIGTDADGKDVYGAVAAFGGEKYIFHGEVKGGLEIFGIEMDMNLSGGLFGGEFGVNNSYTNKNIKIGGGIGAGVGVGVDLSIDYTNFELPEFNLGELHIFPWN